MSKGVLFVSSNPEAAGELLHILNSASIRLDYAVDLFQAAHQLTRNQYTCIVTETSLPDGDWRAVLDLSHGHGNVPVFAATQAAGGEEFWLDALDAGVQDVLVQPFNAAEVLRILGAVPPKADAAGASS